jgi:hypothetical protein
MAQATKIIILMDQILRITLMVKTKVIMGRVKTIMAKAITCPMDLATILMATLMTTLMTITLMMVKTKVIMGKVKTIMGKAITCPMDLATILMATLMTITLMEKIHN